MNEYTIDSQRIAAKVRNGLFSSVYVYYILNYTNKAEWFVSIDPDHYDKNCNAYKKDPHKLIPKEIEAAKKIILGRIHSQSFIKRIKDKDQVKKETASFVRKHTESVMKFQNIKIKDIDWRD